MIKPIQALQKHSGVWRVNGFNNIEIYKNSAPRVYVSLTKIHEKGMHSSLYKGQITKKQIWLKPGLIPPTFPIPYITLIRLAAHISPLKSRHIKTYYQGKLGYKICQ